MAEDQSSGVVYRESAEFPGYRAGSDGSVWSRRVGGTRGKLRDTWLKLSDKPRARGYVRVMLTDINGKRRLVPAHRFVLATFTGEWRDLSWHAAHWNGNPSDNRIENLRWATCKENQADRRRHGTDPKGVRNNKAKLSEAQVLEALVAHKAGRTIKGIARDLGVSDFCIHCIIKGITWNHVTGIPHKPTKRELDAEA